MIRINKFLAQAGIGSRRAADDLIARGAVTIDGRRAKQGDTVDPKSSDVRVNGNPVHEPRTEHITIALNKPLGVVTTMRDERGRPCVGDLIRNLAVGAPSSSVRRMIPIGRLDAQTTGLLLCTTDGELSRNLTHPSRGLERRYRVTVNASPSKAAVRELGARSVRPQANGAVQFEMTLTRGQNREIRRACAQHGLRVIGLERLAFGPVQLAGLQPGRARVLTRTEIQTLKRASVSLKRASARTRE